MGMYIDTRGLSKIAVGICARCSLKFPIVDLSPDPNSPGLMVCGTPGAMTGKGTWVGGYGCSDMYDPYRLPPHEVEDITLEFVRPDEPLVLTLQQSDADDFIPNGWTADSVIVTADSITFTADALAPGQTSFP